MSAVISCKKAEDRTCFKFAGDPSEKEILLESFQSLDLGPHIRYELVQDTVEKVVLSGGENLLNLIRVEVVDNKLLIRNENKCNFLRSYKKEVKVTIHLVNIFTLYYSGSKEISCLNQLNLGYLQLIMLDGAGKCNMNVNCSYLNTVVSNSWGNFELHGQTNYLRMNVKANGFGSAYDLNVIDSLTVISESSGLVKVNAEGALMRAETSSNGDIWYIGTPSYIEYNQYGTGALVDKN